VFADVRLDISPWRPLHHFDVLSRVVHALVDQVDLEPLFHDWSGFDCMVHGALTSFADRVATELGAASIAMMHSPFIATGSFGHPILTPRLRLGRRGNLLTWLVAERVLWQDFREPLRPAARRSWRLPVFPLGTQRAGSAWPPFPVLHPFSRHLVPRPDDWPEHIAITGWLLPPQSTEPLPDEVERFLKDGPTPIYVGFGSMPIEDPERVGALVGRALARTGQRAIVAGPSLAESGLQSHDGVLAATEVPHERLLHRVAAVVHHGGSGTTGAALRAQKPSLVVPFLADQFFWGEQIRRLGAGPEPIPITRLSEHRLVAALRAIASGRYQSAARRLGEQIAAEDGPRAAAERIELIVGSRGA
jgi:sterol 3beta-glucosyltransferase